MKIVTAKTFDNPTEANMARQRLLAEGIECFLANENLITINPLMANALGGIRLQILEEDFLLVQQLLAPSQEYREGHKCPNCQSGNVAMLSRRRDPLSLISFFVAFFTGTYPLYAKRGFTCLACNHEFKLAMG